MRNTNRLVYKIRIAPLLAPVAFIIAVILSLATGPTSLPAYASPAGPTDGSTSTDSGGTTGSGSTSSDSSTISPGSSSATCADGTAAPNGDTSKCTVCADGSTAPNDDPSQCAYCSDNSAAPGGDVSKCFQGVTQGYVCGAGADATKLSINIGCKGEGNPIADAAFAIIRVLSEGVGLIIIVSIILGGIQYSSSRGDPQATAKAVHRLQSTFIALLIYIFGFAILNYIIPNNVLR